MTRTWSRAIIRFELSLEAVTVGEGGPGDLQQSTDLVINC